MQKHLFPLLMALASSAPALAADPATVNGQPIKQVLIDYIVKDTEMSGTKVDDNMRKVILEKLITGAVLSQEAEKTGLLSEPGYKTLEELTLQELRVKAYVADYVGKHPITDAEVKAEYERMKTEMGGKEYKASHIMVASEDQAREIIAKLGKGADFAQLARENSQDEGSKSKGGDVGWFVPMAMVKPFSDATVALQKGAITQQPVKSEFGWHVIRLDDVRNVQPPPYESVKKDLMNSLQKAQLDKMVSELMAQAKVVRN